MDAVYGFEEKEPVSKGTVVMGQFLDTEHQECDGSVGGTFVRIVPATLLNWDDSGELMDIHENGFDEIDERENLNWEESEEAEFQSEEEAMIDFPGASPLA